ncbi:MAG: hypothetical protein LBD53_05605 [Tannerella sp.]|nr:hypothetical protein [Tannerella sp.]
MTNALCVNALAMTDVSSKPLAGFKTTARVWQIPTTHRAFVIRNWLTPNAVS